MGSITGLIYLVALVLVIVFVAWVIFRQLGRYNLQEPFRTGVVLLVVLVALALALRFLGML